VRLMVAILVILELLLPGVAVQHCHAYAGLPSPADHETRPHFHVAGHSHASDGKHRHSRGHSHEHHHNGRSADAASPEVPEPTHDQNAFYVGCDVLAAAVERFELLASVGGSSFASDFGHVADSFLPQFVAYSETGPPEGSIFAPLVVLPHMLRL